MICICDVFARFQENLPVGSFQGPSQNAFTFNNKKNDKKNLGTSAVRSRLKKKILQFFANCITM